MSSKRQATSGVNRNVREFHQLSEVITKLKMPSLNPTKSLLIYDRKLLQVVPNFKNWAQQFQRQYPVTGGETLKDIEALPNHMKKILNKADGLSPKDMQIVSVGGGSVGDFSGFVASLFKRGVSLVHIPSTWLSAIDSAHGGKTAMNVGESKNQIGTYHHACKVYLVKELLMGQPSSRAREGLGELVKMALLTKSDWSKDLKKKKSSDKKILWKYLKSAVSEKYRFIAADPFEEKGIRQFLNLGHTLGHILEAHHGWAHGLCVGVGLRFALEWSFHKKLLPQREYEEAQAICESLIPTYLELAGNSAKPLTRQQFFKLAVRDKKEATNKSLKFVFLQKVGEPILLKVNIEDFYQRARNYGVVR